MSGAKGEQRATPRIGPYVAPCRIVDGSRRESGYLTDLSPKGARVTCDAPPPANGAPVVLEVRFGRRAAASRLPGCVQWSQPGGGPSGAHTLGVTFEGITPAEQQVLESVVAEFQRRAAELMSS